jgi:hypothetical protein
MADCDRRALCTDGRGRARNLSLLTVGLVTPLAGCLPTPTTFSEAMALNLMGPEATFPNCSRVGNLGLAASFDKPAIDMGGGIVAQVKEGFAESPMYRSVFVVHCESGVSLSFSEGGQNYDATGRPVENLSDEQFFSDDPDFLSPSEIFLAENARPGRATDLGAIAVAAIELGLNVEIWQRRTQWFSQAEQVICACSLFYPETELHWFDADLVGPGYPEELGDEIDSPAGIATRIAALRAPN